MRTRCVCSTRLRLGKWNKLAFLLFTSSIIRNVGSLFFHSCSCCCCFVLFLTSVEVLWLLLCTVFFFNRSIDWIDQTAIKMECILNIFSWFCVWFSQIRLKISQSAVFFRPVCFFVCYFIDVQVWAVTQVAAPCIHTLHVFRIRVSANKRATKNCDRFCDTCKSHVVYICNFCSSKIARYFFSFFFLNHCSCNPDGDADRYVIQ